MAHKQIEASRAGTRTLRGVARHFARHAAQRLGEDGPSDGAIHGARKDLKKARAAVRMLREALGTRQFRRENQQLRDAAHSLNAVRDAKVLVQTLESLCRQHRSLRSHPAVVAVGRELHTRERVLEQQLAERGTLEPTRRALRKLARRARHWPVGRHGWSVLGPAFRLVYKRGRKAVPAARPRPSDPALHEWRKQVKNLRYALRMLSPMRPERLEPLTRQAEALTDCLGDAHDLSMLAQAVRDIGAKQHLEVEELLRIIDERHHRLTIDALASGERLYRRRPREVGREFGRYWRHWRRHPRHPDG